MKCLHILPMNKMSGAEKMAFLICKNIEGYTPIVVCGGNNLRKIFEKENIKAYSLNFSKHRIIERLVKLKNIVKDNNITIIHGHDNIASIDGYLIKVLFNLDIKVISHIHNCYPWVEYGGINKKIDSFFRKRYDFNIVCGQIVYDFYKKHTSYLNIKKVEILSNAIDLKEIDGYVNESNKLKRKYGILDSDKVFGFIGRFEEQKGLIPFIKEFSKRKDEFKDCKFLLVGSGSQEKEIINIINELGLSGFFILTGFQEEIYKFYPLIDILFLPSLFEGLPMVLLEAMAFKKIVVSMDVGGIGEVIKEKETGFIVQRNNYNKFIDSLLEALKFQSTQIINNARYTIEKEFDIVNYNNKLINVYDSLIT